MKQQKNKTIFRAVALLLAGLLLLGLVAPALAAAAVDPFQGDTITIRSAEDLLELARRCSLNTWSQGKTVLLTEDISLSGEEFPTIPSFGGTFDGGGHTISGLVIGESASPAGLFGIVQKGAVIKDLTVAGDVEPSGDACNVGGIVGINYGKLTNCSFLGFVIGKDTVGGIAGLNEGSGQLINCSFVGGVTGEHYVGGIAGQNAGSLVRCANHGSINTSEIDVESDLQGLDITHLRSTEEVPAGTDIGGVAGFSTGVIQSCRNDGDVGYEHMGYNVGGIVGRQSGYLDGCVNSGTVRGRKDVGGIAGQLEPQVILKYKEDTLSQLWDELDVLEELMDRTLNDAEDASDSISGRLDDLSSGVRTAKDSTSDLSDAMVDWANENIDQVNDVSARLSWVLDQMDPIMDDLDSALEQAETASGQFSDALDDAGLAAEWGSDAAAALKDALTDLQNASGHGRDAYTHIDRALTHLENSLGDTEKTKAALKELVDAAAGMSGAFSEIAGALSGIGDALDQVYQEAREDENWQDLRAGVEDLRAAVTEIHSALADISGALEALRQVFDDPENEPANRELLKDAFASFRAATNHLKTAYQAFADALDTFLEGNFRGDGGVAENLDEGINDLNSANSEIQQARKNIIQIVRNVDGDPRIGPALEQLADSLADLNTGLGHASEAIVKIDSALQEIEDDPRYGETTAKLYDYLREINGALDGISAAFGQISHALDVLNEEIDLDKAELAWAELKKAASDLEAAADDLDEAVVDLKSALEYMETAGEYLSDAADDLSKASDTMGEAISLLRKTGDKAADVINELAEKPAIQFTPISSDLTERGDALDEALSAVLDSTEALGDAVSDASDILLSDMRAINCQVGVIIDLLRQASEESKAEENEDRFEDISEREVTDDSTSGRISSSRNAGAVEGDINVAGIVGSMAIEYDFDPEGDITEEGDRSLDFHYQTVAVVRDCVNEGSVKAKKNHAGGIAGWVDLGAISACQSYGSVESTNGDYVGGIAGLVQSTIRNSFSKCTLSGGSYVGGIVGSGGEDSLVANCYSLVRITDWEQYAGAVSGTDEGTYSENFFVSDTLSGLGRVSYAGEAEPIPYDALMEVEGLPESFRSFALTFTTDGTILKTVPFSYGDSFDSDVFPRVPEKEGCYIRWSTRDLSDLRFDTEVEAIYTPYITALSSGAARGDGRAVFYVEGDFREGDSLTALAQSRSFSQFDSLDIPALQEYTCLERWKVTFSEDGQVSHTLRFLRPEGHARLRVFVKQDGAWQRAECEEIGRYLAFSAAGCEVEIAIFSAAFAWQVWLLCGLLLLPPLFLCLWKFRKQHREKKAAARQASKAASGGETGS